jgi:hypothetical protein
VSTPGSLVARLVPLLVPAEVPVLPDRRQAKAWAEEELLGREYQEAKPSPVRMLLDWLDEVLSGLPQPEGLTVGTGVTVVIVLGLLVLAYLLWRTGGLHREASAGADGVFDGPDLLAADHRRAAQEAEAAGDLRTALLERFRALVRDLSDRALLDLEAGRTADELARQAASRLPTLAESLMAAAQAFDDVRYGDRPATPEAVRFLRDLDETAARTTPAEPVRLSPDALVAPR